MLLPFFAEITVQYLTTDIRTVGSGHNACGNMVFPEVFFHGYQFCNQLIIPYQFTVYKFLTKNDCSDIHVRFPVTAM